jgi:hypothetical protein
MMLRLLKVLSLTVLSCVLLVSCDLPATGTTIPDTTLSVARQKTVDAMLVLPMVYDMDVLPQADSPRQDGWFDANKYFLVLDHLAMQQGYVIDYVYHSNGSLGRPYLYARPSDETPAANLSEMSEKYSGDSDGYLSHVAADDTEESYFQYTVLRILGGQFALFWHAAYNDWKIVCDHETLEDVLKSDSYVAIPNDIKAKARALDLNPTVKMNQDSAMVSVVVFTKWGGFIQKTYTISRSFPHTVQVDETPLVEWQCGITF